MVAKNEAKNGRSEGERLTEYAERKMRNERKRGVSMDERVQWSGLLRSRGASPQTIAELLDLSDDEDERNKRNIVFARELLRGEKISEDLTAWRFLALQYRNNKRKLPVSFFDILRLEVFYQAIQEARLGDMKLINLYKDTGYTIDPAGFDTSLAVEEDYVASLIDGKPPGTEEDTFGLYREDEHGRKWRQPMGSGDRNGMTFDSSRQSVKRLIHRGL